MMGFGWKAKAEHLRMVILSAGHQMAKELPPGVAKILSIFARVAKEGGAVGGGPAIQKEMQAVPEDDVKLIWEPAEINGWKIQASMYLDNGQHWWLLHAVRRNEREPSASDVKILDKVLEHLGADPDRDVIIGPRSAPEGEGFMAFGWWRWFNRMPLYDVQVKGFGKAAQVRVVPEGTTASDGFQTIPMDKKEDDLDG